MRGAVGAFSPAVSTMLPSVCTTISVAFSVFRLSPIWRAVLPDWGKERQESQVTAAGAHLHTGTRSYREVQLTPPPGGPPCLMLLRCRAKAKKRRH